MEALLLKCIKYFPAKESLVILDFCLSRKSPAGEYHDNRNVIVFKKLIFQKF